MVRELIGRLMILRRLRLIYVEDSADDAALLVREVQLEADIDIATDIREALVRLARGTYDAVLLDLTLPDAQETSGIKTLRAATTAPIIILTGARERFDELAQRAVIAGADGWIEKGTRGAEILCAVRIEIVKSRIERMRSIE